VARLRAIGGFLLITGGVLLLLRAVHVGVPMFLPETRPGPFALASLDEVERRVGFPPIVPAYRPETLGRAPATLTVTLSPRPTVVVVWQGEQYLRLTQRRDGSKPPHPPTAHALGGVPDSTWWQEGALQHLIVRRGAFWIEVETDLPWRDLRRIADTLGPY
jgi:hypothetical protein